MTRFEIELEHLLRLLEPPFTSNWRTYVWHRAKQLAAEDVALADLPACLAQRMKDRAKPESAESKRTPSALLETA